MRKIFIFLFIVYASSAYSEEYLLESRIATRAQYNSNVFLTEHPSEVTSMTITPSITGMVKEKNWQTNFNARVSSYKSNDSDRGSDDIDKFFSLFGRYGAERNIFSLKLGYNLSSNLSTVSEEFGTVSEDFGTVTRRINRKTQSITPGYTRLLTERLALSLSYAMTDVDFEDAENTSLTPYNMATGSGSLRYNLTGKDTLTLSLQVTDYESKNNLLSYQTLISRLGLGHKFSETLSTDLSVGVSRQESTNLVASPPIDFFGVELVQSQEIDAKNRGLVMNVGVKKQLELDSLEARLTRSDTANSFGGLNQVDSVMVTYDGKVTSLLSYSFSARAESIEAIGQSSSSSDRDLLTFRSEVSYRISLNWSANASYVYAQRKLTGDLSDGNVTDSNRVFIGLTYNFPVLSTF